MPDFPVVQFDVSRMRAEMVARGWLATDLAREAGLHSVTVSNFFRGRSRSPRTAKKLADALRIDLRDYVHTVDANQAVAS